MRHDETSFYLELPLASSFPHVALAQDESGLVANPFQRCSMTEDHSDWLNFAASCMSDVQWEVAAIRPEAVLSHRSCPWGGHLIKLEAKTLSQFFAIPVIATPEGTCSLSHVFPANLRYRQP
jgi:hypothetical protein